MMHWYKPGTEIEKETSVDLKLYKYYLHLEAESDLSPSLEILEMLCGKSIQKWKETEAIAEIISQNQQTLMEGIETELTGSFSN